MDTQSIILSTGKCLQRSFHCFSSHFFTTETLSNKTVYAKTNYNFLPQLMIKERNFNI